MISQEHINQLDSKLKQIINCETMLGNAIVETHSGWPKENSIFIALKKPFIEKYEIKGLIFRQVNDIHYWKEEYYAEDTGHILVCRF